MSGRIALLMIVCLTLGGVALASTRQDGPGTLLKTQDGYVNACAVEKITTVVQDIDPRPDVELLRPVVYLTTSSGKTSRLADADIAVVGSMVAAALDGPCRVNYPR